MRRALLVAALGAVGCSDLFGLDEVTEGDGTTSTATSSTTTSSTTSTSTGTVATTTSTTGGGGGAGGGAGDGGGGDAPGGGGGVLSGCPLPWDDAPAAQTLASTPMFETDDDWFAEASGSFTCDGGGTCTVASTQSIVSFGRALTPPADLPGTSCLSFAIEASSADEVLIQPKIFDRLGAVYAAEQVSLEDAAAGPTSWTCRLPGDVSTDAVGFTLVGPDDGHAVDVASASVELLAECPGAEDCVRPNVTCTGAGSIDVEGAPPTGFSPADAAEWVDIPGFAICDATRIAPSPADGLSVTTAPPALSGSCIQPAIVARGALDLQVWLRDEVTSDTIRFSFDVDDPLWTRRFAEPCTLPEEFVPVAVELVTSPGGPTCSYVDLDRIDLQSPGAAACERMCVVSGS